MGQRNIIETAYLEVEEENFRAAVEREKVHLRRHKPWWHYLCPFVINITWRH